MKSIPKGQYFAGSYARLSQEDGDKSESDSIRNQKELIRNFLKNHPEIKLKKEYADDGYSGTSFDRPDFRRMMQDVEEGVINCIIVKDLSRFGRNYIETGQYMEQILPQKGIRLISVNDHYDSFAEQSASDQIMLPFKNLINDAYCRDISLKIRSSLDAKRKKGDYVGASFPYGYRKAKGNKNQLEVDPEAAAVVRRIFRMKMDGKGNGKIADLLNREGVPAPHDYKKNMDPEKHYAPGFLPNGKSSWNIHSVSRILTNEVYVGTMVQGKSRKVNYKTKKIVPVDEAEWIRVERCHEAIIGRREFEIVQRLMMADTRVSPGQEEIFLFSGLLRCGNCGAPLGRRNVTSGSRHYIYYGCYSDRKKIRCPGVIIREETLYKAVKETLLAQIRLFLNMDQLLCHAEKIPLQHAEVRQIGQRIQNCETQIARQKELQGNLYGDYREGILEKEEFVMLKKRYQREVQRLETVRQELTGKREAVLQGKNPREKYVELCGRYQNLEILDRRTLVTLIDQIVIYSKEKIEIHFAFRDEFQQAKELLEQMREGMI